MSRALVTGASGMIGRALVAALRANGWAVDAPPHAVLNVCDARAVHDAVVRVDAVFHLASAFGRDLIALAEVVRVTTGGAANVLAAAGDRPVVLLGSCEEYGPGAPLPYREDGPADPVSAYGAAKLAATVLARAARAIVLRPSLVYGPGQRAEQIVASVVRAARTDGVCRINGGTQRRDLVFVDDVVDAMLRAVALTTARGRVINLGCGSDARIVDLAERIVRRAGRGRLDIGPASMRPGDIDRIAPDISLARALLGWTPRTSFDEGVDRMLAALPE